MKLSNKILIALIGFIFVYLCAALMEIRVRGDLSYLDENSGITEQIDLDDIAVISVQSMNESIVVQSATDPRIELRSLSGDRIDKLIYQQVGDTLILQELNVPDNEHTHITVYVSESTFKGLETVESRITIRDFSKRSFELKQTAGFVRFAENNTINVLNAAVSGDGAFNFEGSMLDTVSLQLENARARINSGAVHVNGVMNDSYLSINNIHHIDLKKDNASRLQVN